MSYDSESLRLAEHFLQDEPKATPADAHKLAQAIQDAVEGWISYELDPCEQCAGSGVVAEAKCDLCGGSGRAVDLRF